MDGFGPGYRPYVGTDRRVEVVSGKGGNNQIYGQPIPVSRASESGSASKPWGGFNDPETKRKKRVAKYKVYTVEGKVKSSLRKGIRWIKIKCTQIVHGY